MIGLTIAKLLTEDTVLTALVPSANIFPLVVDEKTPVPYIAYKVDSIEPEYTKDGWADDLVKFSVVSISDDYAKVQNITKAVRDALEMNYDTGTKRIIVEGYSEIYNEEYDKFVTQLNFSIEVTSY